MRRSAIDPQQEADEAAQAYVQIAQKIMQNGRHEWWMGLLVDAEGNVRDPEEDYAVLWQGKSCRVPDSLVTIPPRLIARAERCAADSLVFVRYHPHQWPGNLRLANARLKRLMDQGTKVGLPVRDAVITDCEGLLYSVRKMGSLQPSARWRHMVLPNLIFSSILLTGIAII